MESANGRFLLGLLAGALVGGALVFLIAPDGASRVDASAGALTADGARGAAVEEGADAGVLDAPTVESRRTVADDEPSVSEARVRALAAEHAESNASPAPAEGGGAIRGTVRDPGGDPVAGVVLRLTRSRSRTPEPTSSLGAGAPELESLDDAVREAAERYHAQRASLRQATSGADGAFRFEGLARGEWWLRAYREGHAIDGDGRVSTGMDLELVARRLVPLEVRVVEADGRTPERAYVTYDGTGRRDRPRTVAWTPGEPTLRLEPGTWEVTALSAESDDTDEAASASETREVEVAADAPAPPVVLELRPRLGVRGRVTTADDGVAVDRLYVRMLACSPGRVPTPPEWMHSETMDRVRPGEEYAFLDLEAGHYAVAVARGWGSPPALVEEVELASRIETLDLELPAVDPARCVRVSAFEPDGDPVEELGLDLRRTDSEGYRIRGADTLRDREGAWLVVLNEEEAEAYFDDPSAEFVLDVRHEEYGEERVELARGQREVRVRFGEPASLVVEVLGYPGSAFEGRLSVDAASEDSAGGGWRGIRLGGGGGLDSDGRQTFEGLTPGPCSVTLHLREEGEQNRYRTHTIETVETTLTAGENRLSLTIPALHAVRVRWPDGKPGTEFSLHSTADSAPSWERRQAEIDAEGLAVFDEVPAGEYVLLHSNRRMPITVPTDEVAFAPIDPDALLVTIDDPGGLLAKMGLRQGDHVVAVDGEPYDGGTAWSWLNELLSTRSAVVALDVLRDGERIRIELRGEDVNGDRRDLGGRFLPVER